MREFKVGDQIWYARPNPNAWAPEKIVRAIVKGASPLDDYKVMVPGGCDYLAMLNEPWQGDHFDIVAREDAYSTEVEACEAAIHKHESRLAVNRARTSVFTSLLREIKRDQICVDGLKKHLERAKRREKKAGAVKRADDIVWTLLAGYPARTYRYALNPGQKCFETEKDAWSYVASKRREDWEEAAVCAGGCYVVVSFARDVRIFFLPVVERTTEYSVDGRDCDGSLINLPLSSSRQSIFTTRADAEAEAAERGRLMKESKKS